MRFVSDSEATEDETTEPQMETKEGAGRHQDKAGQGGPPGTKHLSVFIYDVTATCTVTKSHQSSNTILKIPFILFGIQ